MSREENRINNLFEQARNEHLQTSVNDVQKWIGFTTLGVVLISLLTKIKGVFTKSVVMYTGIILSAGIGIGTLFFVNNGTTESGKVPNDSGTIKKEREIIVQELDENQTDVPNHIQKPETPRNAENVVESEEVEPPIETAMDFFPFLPLKQVSTTDVKEAGTLLTAVSSDEKDYGSFKKIKLSGAVNAVILQGTKENVRIEGENNDNYELVVKNNNGTLTVSNKKVKNNVVNEKSKQTIYITVKDITKLDCSGAIKVRSDEKLQLKTLDIEASGAVNIKLKLDVDFIRLDISGAIDLTLSGKAENMESVSSGATTIVATDFEVKNAKIECSGASNSKIYVTEKLDLEISGASELSYKGKPTIGTKSVTGASKIKQI